MRLTPANDLLRSRNVTASEVGALMATHPYTTPEQIWDRLMGLAPEVIPSEAMDTGSFMETAILRLSERRLGLRARANARTFAHKTVQLCATPDAFVIGQPPGLIEIKLSGRTEMWPMRGPIPDHVAWQVRAQMACTGRATAAVCVFLGAGLRTYLLERDMELEAQMLAAVDQFWGDYVVTGIRPAPAAPVLTFSFDANPIREKETIA